jgi:hypothetical protein
MVNVSGFKYFLQGIQKKVGALEGEGEKGDGKT